MPRLRPSAAGRTPAAQAIVTSSRKACDVVVGFLGVPGLGSKVPKVRNGGRHRTCTLRGSRLYIKRRTDRVAWGRRRRVIAAASRALAYWHVIARRLVPRPEDLAQRDTAVRAGRQQSARHRAMRLAGRRGGPRQLLRLPALHHERGRRRARRAPLPPSSLALRWPTPLPH